MVARHTNRVPRQTRCRVRALELIALCAACSSALVFLSTGFALTSVKSRKVPPKALEELREVTQKDEDVLKVWEFYCKIVGDGELDPAEHEEQFIVRFLENHAAEKPSEATIAQMIAMVQADPTVNDQWRRYCVEEGLGIADPRLLAKDFVEKFLEEQQNMPAGDIADAEQIEQIVELCGSDPEAEVMWKRYADEMNNGDSNPFACSRAFVQRFLEVYAPDKLSEDELEQFNSYMSDPLLKFAWGQYCRQGGLGLLGPDELPRYFVTRFLVAAKSGEVEQGLRLASEELAAELAEAIRDPDTEKRWLDHCRTQGDGTTDALQLGDEFVQSFLKAL
mmetsp:Transcript_6355/g.15304  ORF Transcript_6355/g.15304 Transcript_6355/m.15304 type:complete len:335 (+) Transcript_6355:127-1131(+)